MNYPFCALIPKIGILANNESLYRPQVSNHFSRGVIMSARTDAMLKASGHTGPVLSTLESDDAAFVLTTDTLLFQHLGGVRRVTLRDLTRIHSDQDGLLHIETPAGTALTANLLGFEAADVQSFFTKVKEETARAKNAVASTPTPEATAPTAAVARAFDAGASAPTPAAPASSPVAPTIPQPQSQQPMQPPAPAPSQPVVNTAETGPKIGWTTGAERKPPQTQPQPQPQPQSMGQPGLQPIAQAGHTAATPPTPPTAPTSPPPPPQPSIPAKPTAQPTPPPPTQPPTQPAQPKSAQTVQTQAPLPPISQSGHKGAAVAPTISTAVLSHLTTEAKTADRAAGRLRILAIVLFIAALALAGTLIFSGQAFNGLWILIAGGVGGVALLTVIDIIRLLVAIAQALGAEK